VTLWKPFTREVQKLSDAQGRDKKALLYILKNEQALLKASDRLVQIYEDSDADQDALQKARLRVVNVAGRQRMLTQKMTKEKLLWYMLKSPKQKQKMFQTVTMFEETLAGLIEGDPQKGIPKATNPKIKAQLRKVEQIWTRIKPLYTREKINQKERDLLIRVNPILLKEMHRAVGLMEQEVEY